MLQEPILILILKSPTMAELLKYLLGTSQEGLSLTEV